MIYSGSSQSYSSSVTHCKTQNLEVLSGNIQNFSAYLTENALHTNYRAQFVNAVVMYLLTYLSTYLLTYLFTYYLLTYLFTYLLIYLLTYLITYLLTHSLTPCSTVFLEKLTGFQPVNKFPTFYGTRRFITAVTSSRHLSLS